MLSFTRGVVLDPVLGRLVGRPVELASARLAKRYAVEGERLEVRYRLSSW